MIMQIKGVVFIMKVRDVMTHNICCVSPDMSIENAAKLMSGADIGVIPVCGINGIVGIVTDRDIVTRGVSKGYSADAPVETIMTRTVTSISPDADVKEAVKMMGEYQVRRLPVVSGSEIIGMLSVGDLARNGKLDSEVSKAEQGIAEVLKKKR